MKSYLTIALAAVALAAAAPAGAEPASRGSGSDTTAFREFGKFAKSWMAQMEQRERTNRAKPNIQKQGSRSVASYTGYAPEWDVEVRPTGDRAAPYVGILKYEEQTYTCRDTSTSSCSVTSSTPVTEVFPYQNGAWKY